MANRMMMIVQTFNRNNLRYEVRVRRTDKDIERIKGKKKKTKETSPPASDKRNQPATEQIKQGNMRNDTNKPNRQKEDEESYKTYIDEIVDYLNDHKGQIGIIYVLSRQEAGMQ